MLLALMLLLGFLDECARSLTRLPEGPLEPDERARIRHLLELADPTADLTRLAEGYLAALPSTDDHENPVVTMERRLAEGYAALMAKPWAERVLTVRVIGVCRRSGYRSRSAGEIEAVRGSR
jgi:hypothetical protein